MFVNNPDPYSLPCYRIGPFTTKYLGLNHDAPENNNIDEYFNERFKGQQFLFTINGRKAINLALKHYKLKPTDVVTILTTSGNFYISSCVTKEIEKFCTWSREILPRTKLLFVNHEFGHPYPDVKNLKDFGLPIIEDCANTFFSRDQKGEIGKVGDFIVYSFPKIFPIQIGGLLVSNLDSGIGEPEILPDNKLKYIKNVLSRDIKDKEKIIEKRLRNYSYLKDQFLSLGYEERFRIEKGVVPGVFMFSTKNSDLELPELKKHFYAHGIQCSVFYGEEAFFIPCHQNLEKPDLDYFVEVMKWFMQKTPRI